MSHNARTRSHASIFAALGLAVLSGCACSEIVSDSTTSATQYPTSSASTDDSNDGGDETQNPTSSASTDDSNDDGDATTDLLLAQQIDAFVAGNGAGPDCRRGPGGPDPAVFLSNSQSGPIPGELVYMRHTGLCLSGFDPQGPVVLNVRAGETAWTTQVTLDTEAAEYNQAESSRETLFDGSPITSVALTNSEYFESPTWVFVPPDDARDALTVTGEITVDAEQGDLKASATHKVQPEVEPNQTWIDRPHELAVYGFEPGANVPIGLYQKADPGGEYNMNLVKQIGTVTMPKSRVAVFSVPQELVDPYAGQFTHCVAAPIGEIVYNCRF